LKNVSAQCKSTFQTFDSTVTQSGVGRTEDRFRKHVLRSVVY